MYSNLAIKLYTMVKHGIIKSNALFWREFSKEKVENLDINIFDAEKELQEKNLNVVCAFDDNFPKIDNNIKNKEKPFLFVYKGNIELLSNINNNVTVIGVLMPTPDIENREQKIVTELVKNNIVVVSGLAHGCDTIAHKTCLTHGGKTIAILPTTFDDLYPKENKILANNIIESGGLIITEYVNKSKNKYECINRFIERDRLQAMLSKATILIASFRQGQGDSGSRHAMQKAKEYGKLRYIMFNQKTDLNKEIFGLNQDLLNDEIIVLTEKSMKEITN
ncbi:MAG TPA: transporter [Clostridiales bacterium]|nr:transporter [Clostridiales bacterium]